MYQAVSLAEYGAALARTGLPSTYRRRVLEELREHAEDAGSVETLGTPDRVARDLARAYRAQSWFGRHPAWTWLLVATAPFVISVMVLIALALVIAAAPEPAASALVAPIYEELFASITIFWVAATAALSASGLFAACRLVARGRCWRWSALAAQCLLVMSLRTSLGEDALDVDFDPAGVLSTAALLQGLLMLVCSTGDQLNGTPLWRKEASGLSDAPGVA